MRTTNRGPIFDFSHSYFTKNFLRETLPKKYDASKKILCKIPMTKIENRATVGCAHMFEGLFLKILELSVKF